MTYSDFPMPDSYPDFPHHSQLAEYFDAYVERFGFRDRIRFETEVERAERRDDGRWDVRAGGETRTYDALIVANGHHWDARWPEPAFPGHDRFAGVQMHSHDYKGDDPALFRDRSVVVLGMGNSAMDIAVDSSFAARATYLAARRGAYIVPKYLLGRPIDEFARASPRIPSVLRRRAMEQLLRVVVGDMERFGLPRPDHHFGEAHPTVSDDVLSRIAHGEITPKPNIAELTERTVRFSDGSEVAADVVVYCTGYRVTFPFFDRDLIAAPGNDLPLFRRVFHPEIGGVYFVGLLQPIGAIMPLAEIQSEWVADHLAGRYALPGADGVRADIAAERATMFKRYVASKRHTMQVDFEDYVFGVREERARGERRATLAGHPLPIVPAADAPVRA
jgi:cation diffusion facilitator CzcD-associated flavoprotein CzcO